jgi:hypothetical protein
MLNSPASQTRPRKATFLDHCNFGLGEDDVQTMRIVALHRPGQRGEFFHFVRSEVQGSTVHFCRSVCPLRPPTAHVQVTKQNAGTTSEVRHEAPIQVHRATCIVCFNAPLQVLGAFRQSYAPVFRKLVVCLDRGTGDVTDFGRRPVFADCPLQRCLQSRSSYGQRGRTRGGVPALPNEAQDATPGRGRRVDEMRGLDRTLSTRERRQFTERVPVCRRCRSRLGH